MNNTDESLLRQRTEEYGQEQLFEFWPQLNAAEKEELLQHLSQVNFPEMKRLINSLVLAEPPVEYFDTMKPVPLVRADDSRRDEAVEAGESLLRQGKVACFTVAGGQGTRLGFKGPKGSYPIGPVTGHSLFQYHAEKIRGLQRYYNTTLPWYIMVSQANGVATRAYFRENNYFSLDPDNILFFEQRMVPSVTEEGKIILKSPSRLAMSPGGHGGSVQALVDGGAIADAKERGIEILSYFQVDNWAIKVADPRFIGHHYLNQAEMSSKCHRRNGPRESVGVHCICDGAYRVIEYSELDIYPQLLQVDEEGFAVFAAGNSGIHLLSPHFVQRVYEHFDEFPWHKAFKKIPQVNQEGETLIPEAPNGYKFETFIFDALRFAKNPVALEIQRPGEYTPIKDYDGTNSVVAARKSMTRYWADWAQAAGALSPEHGENTDSYNLEISPAWAINEQDFQNRAPSLSSALLPDSAILADGSIISAEGQGSPKEG